MEVSYPNFLTNNTSIFETDLLICFSSLRGAHDHHSVTWRGFFGAPHDGRCHPEVSGLHPDMVRHDHLHLGHLGHLGSLVSLAGN